MAFLYHARVMKMLLSQIVTFAIVLLPSALLADPFRCADPETLPPAKAQEALAATQRAYRQVSGLEAQFAQRSAVATLGAEELSSGTVLFSKPGRMRWQYQRPEEQLFLVNGETLWLYNAHDRQVVIDQVKSMLISDLPVAFLMGVGDLDDSFEIRKACVRDGEFVFELQPKAAGAHEADEGLEQFVLRVARADYLPRGALVRDVGGNVTAISLHEVRVVARVDDDAFRPSFPTGVDVHDRRARG